MTAPVHSSVSSTHPHGLPPPRDQASENREDRAASIANLVSGLSVSSPPSPFNEDRSADRSNEIADRVDNSPNTSSSTGSAPLSPDRKIPRPKNAFILYRIHHYEAITDKHPGISNPEISKLVGHMWRNEPKEEKDKWTALAAEDKLRHQKQFPGYKFRPKRGAKQPNMNDTAAGGVVRNTSSCQKSSTCSEYQHDLMMDPQGPEVMHVSNESYPRVFPAPHAPQVMSMPRTPYPPVKHFPTQSPMETRYPETYHPKRDVNHTDMDGSSEIVLGSKRRRLEFLHPAIPSQRPEHDNCHEHSQGHISLANYRLPQSENRVSARRESLPAAREFIPEVSPRTVAPSPGLTVAPGPGYSQHRMLMKRGPVGKDLSLTLPPLNASATKHESGQSGSSGFATAIPATGSAPQTAFRQSFPGRLVPLVMLLHKQAVLKKVLRIPPPVAKRPQRAVVIAIDGDDPEAIDYLSHCLAETLRLTAGSNASFMDTPRLPLTKDTSEERRFECLDSVKEWCKKSMEIFDFMMGNPIKSESMSDSTDADQAMTMGPRTGDQPSPVLFIRSWLMSTIDRYTVWIPATNDHRVTEHWEWTAYMWQGVVAPDLIIYVRAASIEEISERGATEVADGGNLMLIRHSKDDTVRDPDGQRTHGFQSGALRRIGFEVGEWLEGRRVECET